MLVWQTLMHGDMGIRSGLARDHERVTGQSLTTHEIVAAAETGDAAARAALEHHADRLARGLAVIVDLIDPDVIVLGAGFQISLNLYSVCRKRC